MSGQLVVTRTRYASSPRGSGSVELRYDPDQPFEVAASFTAGNGVVDWLFARELLAAGLAEPSGRGDVLVAPVGASLVLIRLQSDDNAAILYMPAKDVVVFLARTFAAVPAGDERLDFDAWYRAFAAWRRDRDGA